MDRKILCSRSNKDGKIKIIITILGIKEILYVKKTFPLLDLRTNNHQRTNLLKAKIILNLDAFMQLTTKCKKHTHWDHIKVQQNQMMIQGSLSKHKARVMKNNLNLGEHYRSKQLQTLSGWGFQVSQIPWVSLHLKEILAWDKIETS